MSDQTINCRDCGQPFKFSEKDQQLFADKGWKPPFRCRPCRSLAKQRRPQQDQQTG